MITSNTILFCTGAYVHHSCWEKWIAYFKDRGYRAIAPPWRCKNADPDTLRGQRHLVLGLPRWEEDAGSIYQWVRENQAVRPLKSASMGLATVPGKINLG